MNAYESLKTRLVDVLEKRRPLSELFDGIPAEVRDKYEKVGHPNNDKVDAKIGFSRAHTLHCQTHGCHCEETVITEVIASPTHQGNNIPAPGSHQEFSSDSASILVLQLAQYFEFALNILV